MNLWIRSQDKENLIKPTRLFIAFDKNIATWDRNTMVDLGKYSTKERALEVLDEIQKKIYKLNILLNGDSELIKMVKRVRLLEEDFDVYDMPLD